jgi:hypothetical protein
MAAGVTSRRGETAQHTLLKQLAFVWAQSQGFSACAMEVILPKCRYRADVAAYRPCGKKIGLTAVFECKQALCDLRRDNCHSEFARRRLKTICERRQVLEARLRTHYPNLHNGDSLFPEFDSANFSAIGHRGYARLIRELQTLQNRLYDVLPDHLLREQEVPAGWGALIQSSGALILARKPLWHETTPQSRLDLLQRIATVATRNLNRECGITFKGMQHMRSPSWV